jgi:hypothetical protein
MCSLSLVADPAGLVVLAPNRDLGQVRPGVKRTEVFMVRNSGPEPLRILDLRPECGCLAIQTALWRLAPGTSTDIQVTFTPPDQEGPVSKGLVITTDAPGQEPLRLVLKAQVVADLLLSANSVVFPSVPRNAGGLAEVRLDNRSGEPLQIQPLRSSAPAYLTAEAVPQGQGLRLRLRLDGARLPQTRNQGLDWVEVATIEPRAATFRIQVQWTADPSNLPLHSN